MILISFSCLLGIVSPIGTCRTSCGVGESRTVSVGAIWVGSIGSSWSGLIAICVGMGRSGWVAVSGMGCSDIVSDSSWKENRSWAGVDEMSLADSYIGSSSVPAKFSFAYLDGGGGWVWIIESGAFGCCDLDWLCSMLDIVAEFSSRVAMCSCICFWDCST